MLSQKLALRETPFVEGKQEILKINSQDRLTLLLIFLLFVIHIFF